MGRLLSVATVAAALSAACGDVHATGSVLASAPAPQARLEVEALGEGSGSIRMPDGTDCPDHCTVEVARGSVLRFSAVAAPGSRFDGWAGACSGMAGCRVAAEGDIRVAARFAPVPPPRKLTVSVSGSGAVQSLPPGIDCPGRCSADFPEGQRVRLVGTPAPGWRFEAWEGACSGFECALTLTADASAAATFERLPKPRDDCEDLLPGTPGEGAQALLSQASCTFGTSDASGLFALGYPDGPILTYPAVTFFTVRDGAAVPTGEPAVGSDEGLFELFGQPSGFLLYSTNETVGYRTLGAYSSVGLLVRTEVLAERDLPGSASTYAVLGDDPAGGAVVVRTSLDPQRMLGAMTYQRYGSAGAPETGELGIGDGRYARAVGVSVQGTALVVASGDESGGPPYQARWLNRAGGAVTDWFAVSLPPGVEGPLVGMQALLGGGILLRMGYDRQPALVVPEAEALAVDAPEWLRQRPGARLFPIRGGRGYAATGSPVCGNVLEVLTAGGRSCGCVHAPDLGPAARVGRDGSLIVPLEQPAPATCSYRLYPGLLR